MIYALASDNNSLFYELFSKFISRELSINKHIVNMYAFYLNNEDLIVYYDEKYYNGKGAFIFNHIKYLMKQHNLYYHLDDKLDAEKTKENI